MEECSSAIANTYTLSIHPRFRCRLSGMFHLLHVFAESIERGDEHIHHVGDALAEVVVQIEVACCECAAEVVVEWRTAHTHTELSTSATESGVLFLNAHKRVQCKTHSSQQCFNYIWTECVTVCDELEKEFKEIIIRVIRIYGVICVIESKRKERGNENS